MTSAVDVRFDDGLNTMKLPMQCFEAAHFTPDSAKPTARKISKMDWVPILFITFKVAVFGTGMFFAIKWHYDQGKKATEEASQRQLLRKRSMDPMK